MAYASSFISTWEKNRGRAMSMGTVGDTEGRSRGDVVGDGEVPYVT